MIDGLKPYPDMKHSGVEWLGQVPKHWPMTRAKWLFRKVDRPVRDGDAVVTCFRDGMVTLRKNRRVRGFTESLKEIGYQGIRAGDLVIHAMDAFAGAVGVADCDGKGTPVYSVCKPATGINPHLYAFLVREMARSQWIAALAKGIRERSTDFRFEAFGNQELPVPSEDEQAAIVRFLDHADRRIRRAIAAKQKLIKLLEEQKQAIIYRAVTRGLDPDVRLKPSGVEWLGDVPEHWTVLALKRGCSLLKDGTHLPPPRQAEGYPLLSVRNIINGNFVRRVDDSFISESHFNNLARSFAPSRQDVLLAIVGATIGKVAIVPDMELFHVQRSLAVLRTKPDLLNHRFLAYFLRGPSFQRALWMTVAFSAQPGIYLNTLRNFNTLLPPIEEQEAIADTLDEQLSEINRATDTAHCEISLLKEYRTRLIADVVTGKLDVREAAARLPDEVESAESARDEFTADEESDPIEVDDEAEIESVAG